MPRLSLSLPAAALLVLCGVVGVLCAPSGSSSSSSSSSVPASVTFNISDCFYDDTPFCPNDNVTVSFTVPAAQAQAMVAQGFTCQSMAGAAETTTINEDYECWRYASGGSSTITAALNDDEDVGMTVACGQFCPFTDMGKCAGATAVFAFFRGANVHQNSHMHGSRFDQGGQPFVAVSQVEGHTSLYARQPTDAGMEIVCATYMLSY